MWAAVAVWFSSLAIMALALLWRFWRDLDAELRMARRNAQRVHDYYDAMRRAGINAERSPTN